MKLTVKGGADINLTKSHFLAGGGQGNVYVLGNTAYKIYNDPAAMMPLGKIQELSTITDPNIITPQNILLDTKQVPVGYSMRFVKDTHILCTLFTRAFKERNSLTLDKIQNLILKLRSTVEHIHSKDILIVDLNELNFLVDKSFSEVYSIDTDSYETKSYPATVIMDSVRDWFGETVIKQRLPNTLGRDWQAKKFSKETDWFSFGIIAFQMLISIHPYKGSHSSIKGLKERMLNNISVFNKDVSMPRVCYPLDSIPESYRNWFKAVFEDGKRIAPPASFSAQVAHIASMHHISGNDIFNIEELMELEGNIISIYMYGAVSAILTDKKFYLNRREITVGSGLKLCIPPKSDTVFLAKISGGLLKLFNSTTKEETITQIAASELMTYHGMLYVKNCDKILEIDIMEGKKTLVSGRQVANVLEHASTLYDGVVVQNLLGTYYISVFPTPKVHRQIRIKELDSYKIIDAKFDRNVLMIIGTKNGVYDRFVCKFSTDWGSYTMRVVNDITPAGLNFVTLDTGVCVHITDDEKINIFSSKSEVDGITEVDNDIIGGDMRLFANGAKLLFGRQNKLYSMSMK